MKSQRQMQLLFRSPLCNIFKLTLCQKWQETKKITSPHRLSWGESDQSDCKKLKEIKLKNGTTIRKCGDTMTIHPDVIERIWIPDLFFSNEKQ